MYYWTYQLVKGSPYGNNEFQIGKVHNTLTRKFRPFLLCNINDHSKNKEKYFILLNKGNNINLYLKKSKVFSRKGCCKGFIS